MDSLTEMNLRRWLEEKGGLVHPGIKHLIPELHEFALQFQTEGYESAIQAVTELKEGSASPRIIEGIAEILCREVRGSKREIAIKSVQETFYSCTGITPNLPIRTFGKKLEAFIHAKGSKGFIALFLKLYLFNLIWPELQENLDTGGPTSKDVNRRRDSLERICQFAVDASMIPGRTGPN